MVDDLSSLRRRERRAGRGTFAPHQDGRLLVLGAVEVHALGKWMTRLPAGIGAVALGSKLGPSRPTRSPRDDEETVVGMEVGPAHVARQPLQQHGVGSGLGGIALQDG